MTASLEAALLGLVAPLVPGGVIGDGFSLRGASTEFGLRLSFEREAGDVHVEIEPASAGRPHAVRVGDLCVSYRTGDKQRPLESRVGRGLCLQLAELMRPNLAAFAVALRELRGRARTTDGKVRHVTVGRLLELAGTPDERFYTLSPYVGCLVGCRFCYAQSRLGLLREIEGTPDAAWGSWVDVRRDAPEVLRRELQSLPPHPIKFCPVVSDPYQAIEKKERVTRACLEVLAEAGPRRVLVLTRSALVLDDLALLRRLPLVEVGVSLPTVDEDVRRHFEPRGASVTDRLHVLRELRAAGVRSFAMVQPLLPGDLDAHVEALAAHADSVRVDVLRGVEGAAKDFADPRWTEAATDAWQDARGRALIAALEARGVPLWRGELPPVRAGVVCSS